MIKIMTAILMFSVSVMALDWEKDLDSAFSVAKKEHKNIMVMVESEHCRWCKKMQSETLANKRIEERLKPFVAVKVIREDNKSMAKLPRVYGVPTIFFMEENGTLIEDVVGYLNVEDFASYIDDVDKKVK